jgi:hypothetical protein
VLAATAALAMVRTAATLVNCSTHNICEGFGYRYEPKEPGASSARGRDRPLPGFLLLYCMGV